MKAKERIKKLNKRHKHFCDEYLKDFNATRAYKAIYPTAKDETAATNGGKLLRNAEVSSYLSDKLKKTEIKSIASLNDILREVTSVAMKKPRKTIFKQYDNTKKDKSGMPKIVRDETIMSQPSDKAQLKALELLARYYNVFMNVEDPELTKAKIDKAKAEAKMVQLQVKAIQNDSPTETVAIVDDISKLKELRDHEDSPNKQGD